MAINKSVSSSSNGADFRIANQPVSKRTFSELHSFLAWALQFTNARIDVHRLETEWLHLVRDPRFQDKHLRRAQAEVVIRLATGGAADPKSTGRLLTSRCLAGVGRIRQEKDGGNRAKPARRQVAVQNGDEVVLDHGELDGVGTDGSADDDGMEVDGHDDVFGSNDGNEDGMDLDDASNFNDSGLPPSSPTPAFGAAPPKTPAHHLFAGNLPTPDSTPFAQWSYGMSSGNLSDGRGQMSPDEKQELVELRLLVKHMGAQLREKQYDAEVSEIDAYASKWAGQAGWG